ncbi:hypothetical protein ACVJBD_002333 [Rhizobium mongolense]
MGTFNRAGCSAEWIARLNSPVTVLLPFARAVRSASILRVGLLAYRNHDLYQEFIF